MEAMLRCAGVALLLAGVLAEVERTIPAPGIAIVLGVCLGAYTWFLASTRRANE
jgi:hypothetical protein